MRKINILLLLLVCFTCSVRASVYYAGGVTFLSEAYVTNDSLAGFGTYLDAGSQTVTNWTHVVTNNSANARITVAMLLLDSTTNYISSGVTHVTYYPPVGSPVPLDFVAASNHWDGGVGSAVGVFSAPLGDLQAGSGTVWVTNALEWSYFIGQSFIHRNADQYYQPDTFVWGSDSGTAVTTLSLTNTVQAADAAVAWAAHTSSEPSAIGNFWTVQGGPPLRYLVTTNQVSYFGNWAETNSVTTAGWTFQTDWTGISTAVMVGTVFRIPFVDNVPPPLLTEATLPLLTETDQYILVTP